MRTARRTWRVKSPVEGFIRPARVVEMAQELALAGEIVFPIDGQSLRKWTAGEYKAAVSEFPVKQEKMRPFKNSVLYPQGADVLVAFWYDGRQRGEKKSEWRVRLRAYVKAQKANARTERVLNKFARAIAPEIAAVKEKALATVGNGSGEHGPEADVPDLS